MTVQTRPALRHPADREMIPRALLRAMLALALASLAIVTFAVATDRPTVGQPKPAAIVQERTIALIGGGAQAVTVLDDTGAVLADMEHGGFVTVIQNGLARERLKHGVAANLPVRLVEYANGRLTVHDPETGWSAELHAFGADNKAAFERLLNK
ncbi:MAG: photosynthetic complex assembly protein PuhC [Gemmobacter sp.]